VKCPYAKKIIENRGEMRTSPHLNKRDSIFEIKMERELVIKIVTYGGEFEVELENSRSTMIVEVSLFDVGELMV
jgi:hypothetical protein